MKIINFLAIISILIVAFVELHKNNQNELAKIVSVYKCSENFCYADVQLNKMVFKNVYILTNKQSIINKKCSIKKVRFSIMASYEYICEF